MGPERQHDERESSQSPRHGSEHDDEEHFQDTGHENQNSDRESTSETEHEESFQDTEHGELSPEAERLMRQRKEELYAADTDAAIKHSLQEAQEAEASLENEMQEVLDRSREEHERSEQELHERILKMSLEEAEIDDDMRAFHEIAKAKADSALEFEQQPYMQTQHELEQAKMESAREFKKQYGPYEDEQDALRRAQMESVKAYTEDLFRQNPRNKRLVGQDQERVEAGPSRAPPYPQSMFEGRDDDTQPVTKAKPARRTDAYGAVREPWGRTEPRHVDPALEIPSSQGRFRAPHDNDDARSIATTATGGTMDPGRAVRERWSRAELPRVIQPSRAFPSRAPDERGRPPYPASVRAQDEQSGGYDWTQPPAFGRSTSPALTIRTAESQRPHEEEARSRLYESRTARPPSVQGQSQSQWNFSRLDVSDADETPSATEKTQKSQ